MGSARIKGNVRPTLTLGSPGADISADLSSWGIENEEADSSIVTFEDAAAGGARQFYLRGSAIQSLDAASFWRTVWENSGETDIAYTIAPHGNAVASVTQPHFVGTLTYGPKPKVSAEASTASSAASPFDFEFKIDGTPTLDDGS
jgi:hypothetical protein